MSQANTLLTKVWEVFFFICKNECKIEKQRVKLAKLKGFEPKQAFTRIARDAVRM
jgi:hypothetical protein